MKKMIYLILVLAACTMLAAGNASATVANPDPSNLQNDDGTQLWSVGPGNVVINVELKDLFGTFGPISGFGFYFKDAPNDPITIFGAEDQTVPGDTQSAVINFNTGYVIDLDESDIPNNIFVRQNPTPFVNKNVPIGFVLGFTNPFSGNVNKFYTETSLNGLDGDVVSSFRFLSDPLVYLLSFDANSINLALELVGNVSPVPEPSTILMVASGVAGLLIYKRRRRN